LIVLTLVCLRNKKQGSKKLAAGILFGLYIIAVVAVIFFPIPIPLNWPANLTWNGALNDLTRTNLSPLYFLSFTNHPFSLKWLLVDFGLNALLTIPFGFGLGFFFRPKWWKLFLWALLTGFTLEGIQLLVDLTTGILYHTVDINDVILNSLGVMIGYGLFLILQIIVTSKPTWSAKNGSAKSVES